MQSMLLLGLQVEVLTVTQAYYVKFKLLELEILQAAMLCEFELRERSRRAPGTLKSRPKATQMRQHAT